MKRLLNVTFNASGACQGAERGDLVVIVDVIDMSTTAEALMSMGAVAVLGAAPEGINIYNANPYHIGYIAGRMGLQNNLPILLISEPRTGGDEKRIEKAFSVIRGIEDSGNKIATILPNIGASIVDYEIVQSISGQGFIAVLVTPCGGVCFDVAHNNGAACVLTATTARVSGRSGHEVVESCVRRILSMAESLVVNITVVAASSKALEDVHAAQHIAECIIRNGFLKV